MLFLTPIVYAPDTSPATSTSNSQEGFGSSSQTSVSTSTGNNQQGFGSSGQNAVTSTGNSQAGFGTSSPQTASSPTTPPSTPIISITSAPLFLAGSAGSDYTSANMVNTNGPDSSDPLLCKFVPSGSGPCCQVGEAPSATFDHDPGCENRKGRVVAENMCKNVCCQTGDGTYVSNIPAADCNARDYGNGGGLPVKIVDDTFCGKPKTVCCNRGFGIYEKNVLESDCSSEKGTGVIVEPTDPDFVKCIKLPEGCETAKMDASPPILYWKQWMIPFPPEKDCANGKCSPKQDEPTHALFNEIAIKAPSAEYAIDLKTKNVEAEYIEIYNPTKDDIELSNYYLSDGNWKPLFESKCNTENLAFYNILTGKDYVDTSKGDFVSEFPKGTILKSFDTITVALNGDIVSNVQGFKPTFAVYNPGSAKSLIKIAVDEENPPYLDQTGETLVLFKYEGGKVEDVDYFSWKGDYNNALKGTSAETTKPQCKWEAQPLKEQVTLPVSKEPAIIIPAVEPATLPVEPTTSITPDVAVNIPTILTPDQIKNIGADPKRLDVIGITPNDLIEKGLTPKDAVTIGIIDNKLDDVLTPVQTTRLELTTLDLTEKGITPKQLEDLKVITKPAQPPLLTDYELGEVNLMPKQIAQLGYDSTTLPQKGLNPDELSSLGVTYDAIEQKLPIKTLKETGITPKKVSQEGLDSKQINNLGIESDKMNYAGLLNPYEIGEAKLGKNKDGKSLNNEKLKTQGVLSTELNDFNLNHNALSQLMSEQELAQAGITQEGMKKNGLTPEQLKIIGITLNPEPQGILTPQQIGETGLNPQNIISIGLTPDRLDEIGLSPVKLGQLGVTYEKLASITSEKELAEIGINKKSFELQGLTAQQLADLGLTAEIASDFGGLIDKYQLGQMGLGPDMLSKIMTPQDIANKGMSAEQAKSVGLTFEALSEILSQKQLADLSITKQSIESKGLSTQQLALLGITAEELGNTKGWVSTYYLDKIGLSPEKLAEKGITAKDLAEKGITPEQLEDIGVLHNNLADELSSDKMSELRLTTSDIVQNGISPEQLAQLGITKEYITNPSTTKSDLAEMFNIYYVLKSSTADAEVSDIAYRNLARELYDSGHLSSGQLKSELALQDVDSSTINTADNFLASRLESTAYSSGLIDQGFDWVDKTLFGKPATVLKPETEYAIDKLLNEPVKKVIEGNKLTSENSIVNYVISNVKYSSPEEAFSSVLSESAKPSTGITGAATIGCPEINCPENRVYEIPGQCSVCLDEGNLGALPPACPEIAIESCGVGKVQGTDENGCVACVGYDIDENPCALMKCAVGTECEILGEGFATRGVCVESVPKATTTPCDAINCGSDKHCITLETYPPQAKCVDNNPAPVNTAPKSFVGDCDKAPDAVDGFVWTYTPVETEATPIEGLPDEMPSCDAEIKETAGITGAAVLVKGDDSFSLTTGSRTITESEVVDSQKPVLAKGDENMVLKTNIARTFSGSQDIISSQPSQEVSQFGEERSYRPGDTPLDGQSQYSLDLRKESIIVQRTCGGLTEAGERREQAKEEKIKQAKLEAEINGVEFDENSVADDKFNGIVVAEDIPRHDETSEPAYNWVDSLAPSPNDKGSACDMCENEDLTADQKDELGCSDKKKGGGSAPTQQGSDFRQLFIQDYLYNSLNNYENIIRNINDNPQIRTNPIPAFGKNPQTQWNGDSKNNRRAYNPNQYRSAFGFTNYFGDMLNKKIIDKFRKNRFMEQALEYSYCVWKLDVEANYRKHINPIKIPLDADAELCQQIIANAKLPAVKTIEGGIYEGGNGDNDITGYAITGANIVTGNNVLDDIARGIKKLFGAEKPARDFAGTVLAFREPSYSAGSTGAVAPDTKSTVNSDNDAAQFRSSLGVAIENSIGALNSLNSQIISLDNQIKDAKATEKVNLQKTRNELAQQRAEEIARNNNLRGMLANAKPQPIDADYNYAAIAEYAVAAQKADFEAYADANKFMQMPKSQFAAKQVQIKQIYDATRERNAELMKLRTKAKNAYNNLVNVPDELFPGIKQELGDFYDPQMPIPADDTDTIKQKWTDWQKARDAATEYMYSEEYQDAKTAYEQLMWQKAGLQAKLADFAGKNVGAKDKAKIEQDKLDTEKQLKLVEAEAVAQEQKLQQKNLNAMKAMNDLNNYLMEDGNLDNKEAVFDSWDLILAYEAFKDDFNKLYAAIEDGNNNPDQMSMRQQMLGDMIMMRDLLIAYSTDAVTLESKYYTLIAWDGARKINQQVIGTLQQLDSQQCKDKTGNFMESAEEMYQSDFDISKTAELTPKAGINAINLGAGAGPALPAPVAKIFTKTAGTANSVQKLFSQRQNGINGLNDAQSKLKTLIDKYNAASDKDKAGIVKEIQDLQDAILLLKKQLLEIDTIIVDSFKGYINDNAYESILGEATSLRKDIKITEASKANTADAFDLLSKDNDFSPEEQAQFAKKRDQIILAEKVNDFMNKLNNLNTRLVGDNSGDLKDSTDRINSVLGDKIKELDALIASTTDSDALKGLQALRDQLASNLDAFNKDANERISRISVIEATLSDMQAKIDNGQFDDLISEFENKAYDARNINPSLSEFYLSLVENVKAQKQNYEAVQQTKAITDAANNIIQNIKPTISSDQLQIDDLKNKLNEQISDISDEEKAIYAQTVQDFAQKKAQVKQAELIIATKGMTPAEREDYILRQALSFFSNFKAKLSKLGADEADYENTMKAMSGVAGIQNAFSWLGTSTYNDQIGENTAFMSAQEVAGDFETAKVFIQMLNIYDNPKTAFNKLKYVMGNVDFDSQFNTPTQQAYFDLFQSAFDDTMSEKGMNYASSLVQGISDPELKLDILRADSKLKDYFDNRASISGDADYLLDAIANGRANSDNIDAYVVSWRLNAHINSASSPEELTQTLAQYDEFIRSPLGRKMNAKDIALAHATILDGLSAYYNTKRGEYSGSVVDDLEGDTKLWQAASFADRNAIPYYHDESGDKLGVVKWGVSVSGTLGDVDDVTSQTLSAMQDVSAALRKVASGQKLSDKDEATLITSGYGIYDDDRNFVFNQNAEVHDRIKLNKLGNAYDESAVDKYINVNTLKTVAELAQLSGVQKKLLSGLSGYQGLGFVGRTAVDAGVFLGLQKTSGFAGDIAAYSAGYGTTTDSEGNKISTLTKYGTSEFYTSLPSEYLHTVGMFGISNIAGGFAGNLLSKPAGTISTLIEGTGRLAADTAALTTYDVGLAYINSKISGQDVDLWQVAQDSTVNNIIFALGTKALHGSKVSNDFNKKEPPKSDNIAESKKYADAQNAEKRISQLDAEIIELKEKSDAERQQSNENKIVHEPKIMEKQIEQLNALKKLIQYTYSNDPLMPDMANEIQSQIDLKASKLQQTQALDAYNKLSSADLQLSSKTKPILDNLKSGFEAEQAVLKNRLDRATVDEQSMIQDAIDSLQVKINALSAPVSEPAKTTTVSAVASRTTVQSAVSTIITSKNVDSVIADLNAKTSVIPDTLRKEIQNKLVELGEPC